MSLEALLLDVDGTLADTERDGHRVAFNRAFAEAGLDWQWSVAEYGDLLAVTGGKERIQHYVKTRRPDFSSKQPLPELAARLHKAKTRHYMNLMAEHAIPLRPGVERLLNEARAAGVRLAIATTTTPANVTALFEATLGAHSLEWFDVIAAGDVVPAKKPAPDIFFYAMEKLKLDAAQCMALEDSHNGLLSAKAADLVTVVTVSDYTRDQDFSGADLVVDQLGEPEAPMKLIRGDAGDATFINLDLLRRVHAQSVRSLEN